MSQPSKCWYCGYPKLEIKKKDSYEWYDCPKCHASHVDLPEVARQPKKRKMK